MQIETTLEYIVNGVYLADLDVQIEWEHENLSDIEIYSFCFLKDKYVLATDSLKASLLKCLFASKDALENLEVTNQETYPMASDFSQHSTWGV